MQLLVLNENPEKYKDQIMHLISHLGHDKMIEVHDLKEFHQTIIEYRSKIKAILVALSSKATLEQLLEHQTLFNGVRLVIALPDADTESLNLALKLFPRYVSQDGDPPENIELVLLNILKGSSGKGKLV